MALTLLTIGPVHTLTQNTSFACPARRTFIRSSAALETSLDESTWVALPLTNGMAEMSATFVRCTTTNALAKLSVA